MAAKKKSPLSDTAFRQWCIEMAIRWPTITEYYGNGGYMGGGSGQTQRTIDADVIARAKKIEDWVKGRAV